MRAKELEEQYDRIYDKWMSGGFALLTIEECQVLIAQELIHDGADYEVAVDVLQSNSFYAEKENSVSYLKDVFQYCSDLK